MLSPGLSEGGAPSRSEALKILVSEYIAGARGSEVQKRLGEAIIAGLQEQSPAGLEVVHQLLQTAGRGFFKAHDLLAQAINAHPVPTNNWLYSTLNTLRHRHENLRDTITDIVQRACSNSCNALGFMARLMYSSHEDDRCFAAHLAGATIAVVGREAPRDVERLIKRLTPGLVSIVQRYPHTGMFPAAGPRDLLAAHGCLLSWNRYGSDALIDNLIAAGTGTSNERRIKVVVALLEDGCGSWFRCGTDRLKDRLVDGNTVNPVVAAVFKRLGRAALPALMQGIARIKDPVVMMEAMSLLPGSVPVGEG